MTQNANDVEIANQGFAAFRQDLNDVLEDITTLHSGNTAPTTTYASMWWYEEDTDKLYIRNEDNDAWVEILTIDQANDHLASLGASITLDGTGNVSIDSGDFTVDTDTLHVDSTNNNVLVGKTARNAQDAGIELLGIGASVHSYAGEVMKVNRLTNDGSIAAYYKDNTKVGEIGSASGVVSYHIFDPRSGGVGIMGTNLANIIPTNNVGASADNAKDLGIGSTRWRNLYLGGGVYLGGTGSANKLDDYEEGTWTPYYSATGGTGTVNYVSQRGYYTKIGNRVFFNLYLITSFWGTGGSGDLYISGLPYAASNSTHNFGSLSVGFTQGFIQSPTGGNTIPNSTEIILRKNSSSDARSDKDEKLTGTVGTDVSGGSNKNEIIATGFYFTTA